MGSVGGGRAMASACRGLYGEGVVWSGGSTEERDALAPSLNLQDMAEVFSFY